MAYCGIILFIFVSFSAYIQAKTSGECPAFVCPTVHDDIANDEIQLELVQIPRPPIIDLGEHGMDEDMTHWSCERPHEEVRLRWNDNSHGEGRVEIWYFNKWGTVCNTSWDSTAADVVCKELGFSGAYSSVDATTFGSTTGRVWLDNTECSGDEESLYRCRKAGIGHNQCMHETDAAVICDLTGRVFVSRIGGSNRTLLATNISDSSGFVSQDQGDIPALAMHYHEEQNTLYWIQAPQGSFPVCELRRVIMNGNRQSELVGIVAECNEHSSLTVDDVDGYVYWTETGHSRRIYRKSISRPEPPVELFRYNVHYPRSIVIRKTTRQMYILKKSMIERSDMDLTGAFAIVSYQSSNVKCLTLDDAGGMMYFVKVPGVIKIAAIDGGAAQVAPFTYSETPSSMFLTSGWLVWVEPISKRVSRIALRGGSEDIIHHELGDDVNSPSALTFIPTYNIHS